MSDKPLRPGELNCRIKLSHIETGRGPLGEELPAREVLDGEAWAKKELVSGRKVRTLDQQQVVETCLFTLYPRA
ncbi:head-tail adaptor protein, partial [Salmonella enterica subsp. enterica serovar Agona]|nr:head-tail adaptor protein [Salmonella enterica subsp. enterica serovar Agona]